MQMSRSVVEDPSFSLIGSDFDAVWKSIFARPSHSILQNSKRQILYLNLDFVSPCWKDENEVEESDKFTRFHVAYATSAQETPLASASVTRPKVQSDIWC